jgi:hypothetical protein
VHPTAEARPLNNRVCNGVFGQSLLKQAIEAAIEDGDVDRKELDQIMRYLRRVQARAPPPPPPPRRRRGIHAAASMRSFCVG